MLSCAVARVKELADGTNAPCVKKDTKGVRGKNGDEAHSRQLRVMNFFEYCNVNGKWTPVPIRGSFSYAVTDGEIAEATGILKVQGVARGSGTVPRMQCVADGEEALEKALRDAFPFAELTNDVMHTCGYLSAYRQALGTSSPAHVSTPSSPDCAPEHEDRRDGRLLFQRNKIAPCLKGENL